MSLIPPRCFCSSSGSPYSPVFGYGCVRAARNAKAMSDQRAPVLSVGRSGFRPAAIKINAALRAQIAKATAIRCGIEADPTSVTGPADVDARIGRPQCCEPLAKHHPPRTIGEVDSLSSRCDAITLQHVTDERYYRCRSCGQLWAEIRHADVALADTYDTVKVWSLPVT